MRIIYIHICYCLTLLISVFFPIEWVNIPYLSGEKCNYKTKKYFTYKFFASFRFCCCFWYKQTKKLPAVHVDCHTTRCVFKYNVQQQQLATELKLLLIKQCPLQLLLLLLCLHKNSKHCKHNFFLGHTSAKAGHLSNIV